MLFFDGVIIRFISGCRIIFRSILKTVRHKEIFYEVCCPSQPHRLTINYHVHVLHVPFLFINYKVYSSISLKSEFQNIHIIPSYMHTYLINVINKGTLYLRWVLFYLPCQFLSSTTQYNLYNLVFLFLFYIRFYLH